LRIEFLGFAVTRLCRVHNILTFDLPSIKYAAGLNGKKPAASFYIPAGAKPGDTIHVTAEDNDDAKLSLIRYAS